MRAESEIRGKAERTRVSTKTKAKTEPLYIAEARTGSKAKETTQMAKYAIKSKSKVEADSIERMGDLAKAREIFKAEVKRNGKVEMKTLVLSAAEGIERSRARAEDKMRGA